MKLYLEDDKGNKTEIVRAAGLKEGDVILFLHTMCRETDIEKMEDYLSHKMERKVIILDGRFRDIVTLPPLPEVWGWMFEDRQPRLTQYTGRA